MISWTWHLIGAAIAFGGLNAFDAWRTRARITQSSSTIPPVGSVDRVRRVDNKRLQIDYVVVYALVMFADWLQGPYVFSLYHDEFGLPIGTVARLFVTGFASAGLASLFVGAWADRYGRKFMCLVFCTTYTLSCATKKRNHLPSLFLGRLLGGVSTAILFSSFETWLVSSAHANHMPQEHLDSFLSRLTQVNGFVACGAGLFADVLVVRWTTYKAPFVASGICLVFSGVLIACRWQENGRPEPPQANDEDSAPTLAQSKLPRLNRALVALLVLTTVFETSMYLFVFLWVPMLQTTGETDLPLGTIFAALMLSMSSGGIVYKLSVGTKQGISDERQLLLPGSEGRTHAMKLKHDAHLFASVLVLAAGALLIGGLVAESAQSRVLTFLGFEVAIGVYYPASASLRSVLVAEQHRAQITALFRLPLNTLITVALLSGLSAKGSLAFGICGLSLLCCILVLPALNHRRPNDVGQTSD